MTIEKTHENGGFIKLQFAEFFSEMSSADCREMLHILIDDYEIPVAEIDEKFQLAISGIKSTRRKIHMLNSYKIFRREYMTDGTIQGICANKEQEVSEEV